MTSFFWWCAVCIQISKQILLNTNGVFNKIFSTGLNLISCISWLMGVSKVSDPNVWHHGTNILRYLCFDLPTSSCASFTELNFSLIYSKNCRWWWCRCYGGRCWCYFGCFSLVINFGLQWWKDTIQINRTFFAMIQSMASLVNNFTELPINRKRDTHISPWRSLASSSVSSALITLITNQSISIAF